MTALSCYTANLAAYLRRLRTDADRWVARSVRLAVGSVRTLRLAGNPIQPGTAKGASLGAGGPAPQITWTFGE